MNSSTLELVQKKAEAYLNGTDYLLKILKREEDPNPTIELEFHNKSNFVILNIFYRMYGSAKEKNRIDYLVLSIENTKSNDHFLLSDYWVYKKTTIDNIRVLGAMEGSTFEVKLDNYFDLVRKTLEGDLRDVMEGRSWINIPMDWGPYK